MNELPLPVRVLTAIKSIFGLREVGLAIENLDRGAVGR
jgi:hypothetical protein